jgi:hypothetical protein
MFHDDASSRGAHGWFLLSGQPKTAAVPWGGVKPAVLANTES